MRTEIRPAALDPWRELASYAGPPAGRFGATAVFVGTMRDFNDGDDVQAMVLEHYPGMTERELQNIAGRAMSRWQLLDCLIVHRVGEVVPGDPIVLVSVWSAHRKAAFEACRGIMEELKSTAPFWKKERRADGQSRWVDSNTPG